MVSNFDFAGTHGFGNSVSLRDQSLQQPDSQESISSDIDPGRLPGQTWICLPNLASVQIHGNLVHIQHEGNLDDVPAIRKCVRRVPILD